MKRSRCPDKYGAPCGRNKCLLCSPDYEDLKAEVFELRDETARLAAELAEARGNLKDCRREFADYISETTTLLKRFIDSETNKD